ncbi:EPM2A-interacting protein 1-like [Hydra vulgaris]|uniref:EPM2A-interacting protein 1-like n=1 Tax=Hydra vulgaris TaxID=6087 RepID=UPI001F5E4628|nr:EPM2A-interacting protein 1-like [Hydra vulgaris]
MKTKLNLYETYIASGNCTYFPTLTECQPSRELLSSFSLIVTALYDQFDNRFNKFEDLKKHMVFLCYPFDFDMNDISNLKDLEEVDILKAEDEVINFQCDDELRKKAPKKDDDGTFGGNLILLWHDAMKERFPVLKKHASRLICMYGTSYQCEQTLSAMKIIKNVYRTRLTDTHLNDLVRAATTK